jgi:6-pyruvoyltetrahydropterin/6-carboxytetrahydropterin synthase
MFEVSIHTYISAAHRLRNYQGNCESLHGHNWKVEVTVQATELNEIGLAIDFKELKNKTHAIVSRLDHTCLNDLKPFDEINPSSENMAKFLFTELKKELAPGSLSVKKVSVWESENSWVTYYEDQ